MKHTERVRDARHRRIEQIGTLDALPGVRAIEWHESDRPDGHFLRTPLPDVVCTINLGVIGSYRVAGALAWQPFPRVALRGVSSAPSEGVDPEHGWMGYVSVVLAPWATSMYTGVAAAAIADRIEDVSPVSAWHTLHDALMTTSGAAARLELVTRWLTARLHSGHWSSKTAAVVDALRNDDHVSRVARTFAVTPRRVHQICRDATGHPPAQYRQIARFARLARSLHDGDDAAPWSAFAHEYADHAHAIRSFQKHARVTPRTYLATRRLVPRTYSVVPLDSEGSPITAARRAPAPSAPRSR